MNLIKSMTVKLLASPQFRDNIKVSFKDLANRDMQMEEWVDKNYAHPYCDSLLLYVLNDLYNDHDLDEKAMGYVGDIFYNEEEAKAVDEFCKWFSDLIGSIGENEPDSAYLNHPEWLNVWAGTKRLYEIMETNDKKYDIHASWEAWRSNETLHSRKDPI